MMTPIIKTGGLPKKEEARQNEIFRTEPAGAGETELLAKTHREKNTREEPKKK